MKIVAFLVGFFIIVYDANAGESESRGYWNGYSITAVSLSVNAIALFALGTGLGSLAHDAMEEAEKDSTFDSFGTSIAAVALYQMGFFSYVAWGALSIASVPFWAKGDKVFRTHLAVNRRVSVDMSDLSHPRLSYTLSFLFFDHSK